MKKRWLVTFGAAVALAATGAAVAVAAGVALPFSGDGNTINGCYSSGGALKLLTPTQSTCPDGFSPIQWNVTGPQGPAGPQGPKGDTGDQGPQGPPGPSGSSDVYVSTGNWSIPPGEIDTVVSETIPAGTYTLSATVLAAVHDPSNDELFGDCKFATPDVANAQLHQYPELGGVETSGAGVNVEGTIPLLGDVTIAAPAEVRVDCLDGHHGGDYWGTLYATRVSEIHRQ